LHQKQSRHLPIAPKFLGARQPGPGLVPLMQLIFCKFEAINTFGLC